MSLSGTTKMESLFSALIVLLLVSFSYSTSSEALTSNNENVTIKWDIVMWKHDGYVAVVTAYNHQKQRSVPGWKMSWRWTRKEVIRSIIGAQATKQGDCSKFTKSKPSSCLRNPIVVDVSPSTPYTQQIANCCKSGILNPGSESSLLLTVGKAGNSNRTARMPLNFMFTAPKQQYICGPAKIVRPTMFTNPGTRGTTSAFMTWNVTCVFNKAA